MPARPAMHMRERREVASERKQLSLDLFSTEAERRCPFRKSASAFAARPRCEIAFFSSTDISANVRSRPAGTKIGS